MTVRYIEHPPPPDLAPWVACFWQIQGGCPQPHPHRVLPDGCADWLLDLQAARRSCRGAFQLVGPMTTAQVVTLQGPVDQLGVRLRAGVVGALADLPASELLDAILPAQDLPAAPRVSLDALVSAGFPQRVGQLASALRTRLAGLGQPDPVVRGAMALWSVPGGDLVRVAALARQLGLSERALERRFRAHVGLTAAGYRRLVRFRAVLRSHAAGERSWAALAALCGFTDQSHLTRDFAGLAGLPPSAWAASQGGFLHDGEVTT